MINPIEAVQANPLYDLALEEVAGFIPSEIPEHTPILLKDVRELMCMAWMRGVGWQEERAARGVNQATATPVAYMDPDTGDVQSARIWMISANSQSIFSVPLYRHSSVNPPGDAK